jgi:hypothetical protein
MSLIFGLVAESLGSMTTSVSLKTLCEKDGVEGVDGAAEGPASAYKGPDANKAIVTSLINNWDTEFVMIGHHPILRLGMAN